MNGHKKKRSYLRGDPKMDDPPVHEEGKVTMAGMKSHLDDLCDSTFTSMFCCLPDAKMASRHKGP